MMTRTKLLIANYIENSLISELAGRNYEIATVNTRIGGNLASRVDVKRFDLIYFAKFYPPMWDDTDIIFHHIRIPIIYAFHAPTIVTNSHRLKNYVINAISSVKLSYMKIAKSVTAFHVLNTCEYNLLESLGFKCYFVPLGVNTKRFKPGLKSDRFTVVFVSARYQKGVDMLVKIVPEVLKKAPDLRFILTGTGFLTQYFVSLKRAFNNNVEIRDSLPRKDFIRLFSSSHILLFPSRYETFGLVVLEALSSGMPIVCYDIAGAPKDIVKRYGVGVVANNFHINEIINGILHYYKLWKTEVQKFESLSIDCRNVALKYDWIVIADFFDIMFKNALFREKR